MLTKLKITKFCVLHALVHPVYTVHTIAIFLHGCEIKSGSGLGTRLRATNIDTQVSVCTFIIAAYGIQRNSLDCAHPVTNLKLHI